MSEYGKGGAPDKSLVVTPVEQIYGSPSDHEGGDNTHGGVDGLPKESGGLATVTFTGPEKPSS